MKRTAPLAVFLFLASQTLAAQPGARMVKDVNPSTALTLAFVPVGSSFTRMGDAVYFASEDGIHGTELWRSDGTPEGTFLVRDLCPGTCPSLPNFLTPLAGLLFFSAQDDARGRNLWRSDGTPEGTWPLDIVPGLSGLGPLDLAAGDGVLYFSAITEDTGRELWRTDGTIPGTYRIADIRPGPEDSNLRKLRVLGGALYFAADDGVHGLELWTSDGTPAGTRMVKDIRPGPDSSGGGDDGISVRPSYIPLPDGSFLFTADDGIHGQELWRSDGTAEGTVLVKDIYGGAGTSRSLYLTAMGGQVFFSAIEASAGAELWKSDGSPEGTVRVKDIHPGIEHSFPGNLTAVGSRLFFSARDEAHGRELWVSDGTESGTVLVADINPGPNRSFVELSEIWSFFPFEGEVVFYANDGTTGSEPWISDGTEVGTTLLRDIGPGASGSFFGGWTLADRAAEIDGKLLVRLFTAEQGYELWATDGTPAGTQRILDLDTQTSSIVYSPLNGRLLRTGATVRDSLFYSAFDGVHGEEPWVSDGTAAGTALLANISSQLWGSRPGPFVAGPDRAFFRAENSKTQDELWASDGTAAGTHRMAAPYTEGGMSPNFDFAGSVLGDDLFFGGITLAEGNELWASDGTPAGTRLVRDIRPLGEGSFPASFLRYGDLYFSAAGSSGNDELWKTDGSAAGTLLVAEINPAGRSAPENLVVAGERLFFTADDGTTGRELWVLDGEGAIPRRVKDIRPGPGDGVPTLYGAGLTAAAFDGILYFVADDGASGQKLWRSDGTEAGTFVIDLVPGSAAPGSASAEPRWLTATEDALYFVADDGVRGRELWRSEGTAGSTKLVMDIAPGLESSAPSELLAIRSTLYFSAYQPATGRELWRTTPAGAELVADIAPGPLSSSPLALRRTGPYLLFAANDHVHGFELWAVAPQELFEDGFETGDTSRWSLAAPKAEPKAQ